LERTKKKATGKAWLTMFAGMAAFWPWGMVKSDVIWKMSAKVSAVDEFSQHDTTVLC